MPGCVLRVSGACTKVQRFLEESSLPPFRVFWKGEPRGAGRAVAQSGFNLVLSEAGAMSLQARQVSEWSQRHRDVVRLIAQLGFDSVSIDFGLRAATAAERPWPSYSVPLEIARLAVELGASVELSFYT